MEGLGIGCGNGGGSSRCSVLSDEDALSDGVFWCCGGSAGGFGLVGIVLCRVGANLCCCVGCCVGCRDALRGGGPWAVRS